MIQHAKNKLKMYQTVRTICTDHQADWANLPAFETAFAQFSTQLDELEQAAYHQGLTTIGITAAKNQLRNDTLALAEVVANALRAYAATVQDVLLAEQLRFAKWEFLRNGGQRMLQLLDRILALASAYTPELTDYGIAPSQLVALSSKRALLGEAIVAPRASIVTRRMHTLTIGQLMQEIDQLLRNRLDQLAGVLKPASLPFYEKYGAARVIVDHKGKKIAHGSGIDPVGDLLV